MINQPFWDTPHSRKPPYHVVLQVVYPIIIPLFAVFHRYHPQFPTGAGFLPSTVSCCFNVCSYFPMVFHVGFKPRFSRTRSWKIRLTSSKVGESSDRWTCRVIYICVFILYSKCLIHIYIYIIYIHYIYIHYIYMYSYGTCESFLCTAILFEIRFR